MNDLEQMHNELQQSKKNLELLQNSFESLEKLTGLDNKAAFNETLKLIAERRHEECLSYWSRREEFFLKIKEIDLKAYAQGVLLGLDKMYTHGDSTQAIELFNSVGGSEELEPYVDDHTRPAFEWVKNL